MPYGFGIGSTGIQSPTSKGRYGFGIEEEAPQEPISAQEQSDQALARYGITDAGPVRMSQPPTLGGPNLGLEFTPLTQAPITDASKALSRDIPQELKNQLRGGTFDETTMEIDHIAPVSLGGTRADYNLQALSSEKERQEGKVAIELENIERFQKGEITQGEAIYNILQYQWYNEERKKLSPTEILKSQLGDKFGAVKETPKYLKEGFWSIDPFGKSMGDIGYSIFDTLDERPSTKSDYSFGFNPIEQLKKGWNNFNAFGEKVRYYTVGQIFRHTKADEEIAESMLEFSNFFDRGMDERAERLGIHQMSTYDPRKIAYNVGTGGQSLALAVGVTVATGNPNAGAAVLSVMESSGEYTAAREFGKSPNEAMKTYVASGVGTFISEKIGMDFLFKRLGGNFASNLIKHGLIEGAQETSQTWWQNIVAKKGYDEARKVTEGTIDTFIASFILGLLGGGATEFTQNKSIDMMNSEAIKMAQDKMGLSKEDARAFVQDLSSVSSQEQIEFMDNLQELESLQGTAVSQQTRIVDGLELDTARVNRILNDVAAKADRAITGTFNKQTELGNTLRGMQDQVVNIDSPVKLYQELSDVIRAENLSPSLETKILSKEAGLLGSIQDFFVMLKGSEQLTPGYKTVKEVDAAQAGPQFETQDGIAITTPERAETMQLSEVRKAKNSILTEDKTGSVAIAIEEIQQGISPPINIRILENGELFIEDGRHRLIAYEELGIEEIPINDVTALYQPRTQDSKVAKELEIQRQEKKAATKIVKVPRHQLPVKPQFGKGEKKASRLAARMRANLEKISDEQIERLGLPTYKAITKESQLKTAAKYVNKFPEEAMDVLRGDLSAPKARGYQNLLTNAIFIAMMENARFSKDMGLITELATLRSTRFGQELSILTEVNEYNPTVILSKLKDTRIEAYNKTHKTKAKKAEKTEADKIKKKIKAPTKDAWLEFIKEIEC
jgi:hypothetical protein